MTEQEFAKGLAFLKSYYTNWNFDLSNMMALSIWYENFKELEYQSFQEVVKNYCRNNRFPPQSPFDILDTIPKELDENQAWDLVADIIIRSGYNKSIFLNMIYKENKTIYEFVKNFDIENVEKDSFGNKCLDYVYGRKFRRNYKEYLDSIKVKYINNKLINYNYNNQQILLENKE